MLRKLSIARLAFNIWVGFRSNDKSVCDSEKCVQKITLLLFSLSLSPFLHPVQILMHFSISELHLDLLPGKSKMT